jgi:hypothetical protein
MVETQLIRATFNRLKVLSIFSGKNITELDNFDVRFKAYFKVMGLHDAQKQIKLTITYFEGNPQKTWFRREKLEPLTMTWKDFIIYLKSLIADPANALTYVSLCLKEIRQK